MAGRPRIHLEEQKAVTYRLPKRLVAEFDVLAKEQKTTMTALISSMIGALVKRHQDAKAGHDAPHSE